MNILSKAEWRGYLFKEYNKSLYLQIISTAEAISLTSQAISCETYFVRAIYPD
jgi:hypothetical protein